MLTTLSPTIRPISFAVSEFGSDTYFADDEDGTTYGSNASDASDANIAVRSSDCETTPNGSRLSAIPLPFIIPPQLLPLPTSDSPDPTTGDSDPDSYNHFADHPAYGDLDANDYPGYAAYTALDITRHDAIFTAFNPATGKHRTFQIKTVSDPESNLHGKRIISLRTGPAWGDWTGFGFVSAFGVQVWAKHRGTQPTGVIKDGRRQCERSKWEKYADMVSDMRGVANRRGIRWMVEMRCRVCGRVLTHPESLEGRGGVGPECARRMG